MRVAVFTTFYEAHSGFSLIAVTETQLRMLLDHGHRALRDGLHCERPFIGRGDVYARTGVQPKGRRISERDHRTSGKMVGMGMAGRVELACRAVSARQVPGRRNDRSLGKTPA